MGYMEKAKEWEANRKARQEAPAREAPGDRRPEGVKASALLERQGWVAIESAVLGGETVIWTRDARVVVPTRWSGHVAYTLVELAALAAEPRATQDGLKRIHAAKRVFAGATVLALTEPPPWEAEPWGMAR